MRHKKSALFKSLISLLLCFSMLIGTTFAWFTDSVMTGINTIAAGNLDVELFHSNAAVSNEQVDSNTKLFMDLQGDPILWEPGVVSYENLRVTNAGYLALAYQLAINTDNENFVVDASGAKYGLSQVLKVGVVEGGITATDRAGVVASVEDANWTTLANFLRSGSLFPEGKGESEKTWGVVIYWEPGEYDNLWNLNNGKQLSEGDVLTIDLGIRLIATQEQFENDSFGSDYDETAKKDVFPEFEGGSASVTVVPNDQNQTASEVVMISGGVKAVVPAGVRLAEGTTQLVMTVRVMAESGANVVLGETDAMRSLDVHIEGISPDNTVPITVTLEEVAPVGLNMGNYKLYHVENGATVEMTLVDFAADFTSHNQFKYDPATGDVVLYMATFSEVAVVADTTKAWNGEVDHSWYVDKQSPYSIANADQLWSFSQIVGGMASGIAQDSFNSKTVKLVSDINLDDAEESNKSFIFYPIGYNCSDGKYEKTGEKVTTGFYTFEGTFDGQGHSIANFYQNTWEMKGDNEYYAAADQHYRDGMGLFGKVYGGTVKNLTVKNFKSDGEYTTTGVIAAYADSKTDKSAIFENIAIIECNPRVYNIGNGGIVGCGGWYSKDTTTSKPITFRNITVDKTNKISALWGSYDVACGGIMGQYYPNSGCGVKFENCNMAAQMDVYNDVCGNYQYYAYRYAGMMIGSIRNNLPADENGHVYPDMAGITASNCTVNFGDWNDYYYCEFVKNGHPSYSGPDDYKFSRVPNEEIKVTGDDKYNSTCIGHNHTDVEDNQAIYLPFSQLFTGYGWGVTSKGLNDFDGITIQITESDQNESVKKFETKFTGNFLYRVGNQNTVNIGSLFDVVKNEDGTPRYTINSSGVVVTIDNYEKDANVGGTFKANTSDWTKGTIQFSGTGLVKITIQDYDYCTPTELIVEVIDAKNATSAASATANNVVLLNDVTNGSFSVSAPYGFYGNGFTVTLNPSSHSTKRGAGFDGYIHMNGGTLDNIRIEGPTFAAANIYREQGQTGTGADDPVNYFRNGVIIDSGNVKITNSYLSGARTALYVKGAGDVVLENTTVSGGAYANIEVSVANTVILRNVKTVQKVTKDSYGQNKDMIGLAIVIDNAETKLVLDGVNQDNWMTYDQWKGMLGTYESQFPKLFTDTVYTDLWHKNTAGTKIVNTGIIYACDVTTLNMEGNIPGYDKTSIKVSSTNGYVYTLENGGNSDKVVDGTSAPDYGSDNQTAIPPVTTFDYTNKNYQQYVDGEDVYCYYDAGAVKIGFTKGDSKVWDPMILSIKKDDKTITDYKVKFNGEDYTNKSIAFTEPGKYEVEYTYTDPYNYRYNDDELVSYSVEYTEKVSITVNVTEEKAKNAEFSMKDQPVDKVQVGDKTYLSATGVTASDLTQSNSFSNSPVTGTIKHNYNKDNKTGWGCLTISGQTIYFPIVPMLTTDNTFEHTGSWYGCFPVFEGIIEIKDYANQGTAETPTVYNGNTTTMPTTLKALDPQNYFVYQGTVSKVPTEPTKVTKGGYNGKLCYTTQTDLTASNERGEVWTLATYTYTDNKGATYYWYVGYYCAASSNGGCFTGDTLITLADGTQKRIDQLNYNDKLLVWDFYNGCYTTTTPSVIYNHGDGIHTVTNLHLSDGTTVKIINEHEFFDAGANSFVYISQENVADYIGHKFIKTDGNGCKTVTLKSYSYTQEETGMYTILTAKYNNAIAEGMLSLTPDPTNKCEDFFRLYEVGEGMKYDQEKMQADIEKYGLFAYEDLAAYVTYEEFVAFNGEFYKILVGKGLITVEDIVMALATYAPNH